MKRERCKYEFKWNPYPMLHRSSFFFSQKLIHLYQIKSQMKPNTLDATYLPLLYPDSYSQNQQTLLLSLNPPPTYIFTLYISSTICPDSTEFSDSHHLIYYLTGLLRCILCPHRADVHFCWSLKTGMFIGRSP